MVNCSKCGEDISEVKIRTGIGKNSKPWSARFCPCGEANWITDRKPTPTYTPPKPKPETINFAPESKPPKSLEEKSDLKIIITQLDHIISILESKE